MGRSYLRRTINAPTSLLRFCSIFSNRLPAFLCRVSSWTFDHDAYAEKGAAQWIPFGGFLQAESTAFLLQEPDNWFVCYFYGQRAGFPRQSAQDGFCSMTPRFECDHADAIAALPEDDTHCARYKISGSLKPSVQKMASGVVDYFPTPPEPRIPLFARSSQRASMQRRADAID